MALLEQMCEQPQGPGSRRPEQKHYQCFIQKMGQQHEFMDAFVKRIIETAEPGHQ